MNHAGRTNLISGVMLGAALWLLSGCNEAEVTQAANARAADAGVTNDVVRSAHSVPSGTSISVTLGSTLSSETAQVGDSWHGTVSENVMLENDGMIPAGSDVDGRVTGVTTAERGSRAMLDLAVRSIRVHGRNVSMAATSEAVVAGSTRARNLGAIAGGAVAGALIGKVVGDGKNAAVGGLLGGAAATGVVAGSKGYQVVLTDGTVMNFTVSQTVAMR